MVLMAWVLVATCESVGVSPQTPARPPFYQIRRLHGGAWSVLGTLTRLRGGASSSLKYYRVLGTSFLPACARRGRNRASSCQWNQSHGLRFAFSA